MNYHPPMTVVATVCRTLDLPIEAVQSLNRSDPISRAKMILCVLLRTRSMMSYPKISKILAYKTHSSVVEHCQKHSANLLTLPGYQEHFTLCENALNSLPVSPLLCTHCGQPIPPRAQ